MAKIWYDASGVILRLAKNEAQEAQFGAAPPGTSGTLAFDENANSAAIADLDTNWNAHTCPAGVLKKDGANVTINADLPATTQAKAKYIGAVRLTANAQNTTNSLADVPGLAFQLEPNSHYIFSFAGAYSAAAGTTGISLAVNGPTSPVLVRMIGNIAESATASRNGAVGAYNTSINGVNSGGATPLPFWLEGNISTNSQGGLLQLRFASEVNGSAVNVLAGSWGELKKVG